MQDITSDLMKDKVHAPMLSSEFRLPRISLFKDRIDAAFAEVREADEQREML